MTTNTVRPSVAARGYLNNFGRREDVTIFMGTNNTEVLMSFPGLSSEILCLTPHEAIRLANRLLKAAHCGGGNA